MRDHLYADPWLLAHDRAGQQGLTLPPRPWKESQPGVGQPRAEDWGHRWQQQETQRVDAPVYQRMHTHPHAHMDPQQHMCARPHLQPHTCTHTSMYPVHMCTPTHVYLYTHVPPPTAAGRNSPTVAAQVPGWEQHSCQLPPSCPPTLPSRDEDPAMGRAWRGGYPGKLRHGELGSAPADR